MMAILRMPPQGSDMCAYTETPCIQVAKTNIPTQVLYISALFSGNTCTYEGLYLTAHTVDDYNNHNGTYVPRSIDLNAVSMHNI